MNSGTGAALERGASADALRRRPHVRAGNKRTAQSACLVAGLARAGYACACWVRAFFNLHCDGIAENFVIVAEIFSFCLYVLSFFTLILFYI